MSTSPLVFAYSSLPTELDNTFVNAPTSPLPGTSSASLANLQSSNLILQGVTFTIQFYNNLVTPATGETTSLTVKNLTIIASSGTNTIGTLSYVFQYQNPVPGSGTITTRTRIAKTSSLVNAASGIFANYLFGNVITVYNNSTFSRTISIYSAQ